MRRSATGLIAAMVVATALAGCQKQMAPPPPSFAAPVIRLPEPVPLPGDAGRSGAQEQQARRQAAIATVIPEQLINAAALKPKVPARAWQYIIIHHSDTSYGSALRFHKAHQARGWDMLGYDFVIGNGTETRDGLIEVGPRWTQQLDGAHTGTPDHLFNEKGIGICLVGNFDETHATAAQFDSLARLCAYLMKTYNIPANRIIGHRDAKPTSCPGRLMYGDLDKLRALAKKYQAQMK